MFKLFYNVQCVMRKKEFYLIIVKIKCKSKKKVLKNILIQVFDVHLKNNADFFLFFETHVFFP